MFRVQLRDAANRDQVLVPTFSLPYDPPDGKEIRVRKSANDTKYSTFRIVDHIYEAVTDDPEESGFVLIVTPVAEAPKRRW